MKHTRTLQTKIILLEILKELQLLGENPSLQKELASYYSLSSVEEKKLLDAHALIAHGAELSKKSDDMLSLENALKDKEDRLLEISRALSDKEAALSQKKIEHDAKDEEHKKTQNELAAKEKHLSNMSGDLKYNSDVLDGRYASLKEREAIVKSMELAMQAKADKIKELATA